MICPRCKNKGWEPTKDERAPLKRYRTETFDTVNYRYTICMQCGHAFVTKEVFERDVVVRRNQISMDLDTDGHKQKKAS